MNIIDSLEDRIIKLEEKVQQLEAVIQKSKEVNGLNDTCNQVYQQPMQPNYNGQGYQQPMQPNYNGQGYQQPMQPNYNGQGYQQQMQPNYSEPIVRNGSSLKEAVVGKYIIGALAALLVFIGAISLVGLVWGKLTPEIKLALILVAGIVLTVIGFWLIQTKKNPITSIILGTGAGLLFIAILSANIAFHLIGNSTTIVLACAWAIFFILSSRFTNVFFTTIIAYIGSFIALALGLCLLKGDTDLLLLILFTTIVSGVMIYHVYENGDDKELIASITLSILSYNTILFRTFFDGMFHSTPILEGFACQTVVIVIIYVLLNLLYKRMDEYRTIPWHLIISLVVTISTAYYINNLSDNYLHLGSLVCLFIFLGIHMIQYILNHILLDGTEDIFSIYYVLALVVISIMINMELWDAPNGIVLVSLFVLITARIFQKDYDLLIGGIIVFDALFGFLNDNSNFIFAIYGILQVALIIHLLYMIYHTKSYRYIDLLKIIGIITIMVNSFGIPRNIVNSLIASDTSLWDKINGLGYFISVISLILLIKFGFFKDWIQENENKQEAYHGNEICDDVKMLFYLITTILYFVGLWGIRDFAVWYEQLLYTISTIVIALIQTYTIITHKSKEEHFSEIWIGIKWLLFTWNFINSFTQLELDSVIYSIAGLLVAIASISFGFKFRFKSLRLYGLILTIVMVAKFILIDLSKQNSITRVVALVFGGLICFGISVIYNMLNTKIED